MFNKTNPFDKDVYGISTGCSVVYIWRVERLDPEPNFTPTDVISVSYNSGGTSNVYLDGDNWIGSAVVNVPVNLSVTLNVSLNGVDIASLGNFNCQPIPYPPSTVPQQTPTIYNYQSNYYEIIEFNFSKSTPTSIQLSTTNFIGTLDWITFGKGFINYNLGKTNTLTTISSKISVPVGNPFNTDEVALTQVPSFPISSNVNLDYTVLLYPEPSAPNKGLVNLYIIIKYPRNYTGYYSLTSGLENSYYTVKQPNILEFAGDSAHRAILYGFNYDTSNNDDDITFKLIKYQSSSFVQDQIISYTVNTNRVLSYTTTSFTEYTTPINIQEYETTMSGFDQPFSISFAFNLYHYNFIWRAPYGIIKMTGNTFEFSAPYLQNVYMGALVGPDIVKNIGSVQDFVPPTITSLSFRPVRLDNRLLTIVSLRVLDSSSGVYQILINNGEFVLDSSNLEDGSIYNGTYEKLIDYTNSNYYQAPIFQVSDVAGNVATITNFIEMTPIPLFPNIIPNTLEYRMNHVMTFFEFRDIVMDLSTSSKSNQLKVNFTYVDPNFIVKLTIFDGIQRDPFLGYWDYNLKLFIVDFNLPPYPPSGYVDFKVEFPALTYHSYMLDYYGFSNQKLLLQSTTTDRLPPMAVSITAVPSNNPIIYSDTYIGWDIVISDSVSGIKSVKASAVSNINRQPINATVVYDTFQDTVSVRLSFQIIASTFVSQIFTLNYLEFTDNNGMVSFYEYNHLNELGPTSVSDNTFTISPLMQMFNALDNLTISATSTYAGTDLVPPFLTYYHQNAVLVDVMSDERTIIITFNVSDTMSISNTINPYCYAHGLLFSYTGVQASLQSSSGNNASFQCALRLPYGFGYPGQKITFSIHGYADDWGRIGGVSYNDISTITSQDASVNVQANFTNPYLDKITYKLSPDKNKVSLTIYGYRFGVTAGVLSVNFNNGNSSSPYYTLTSNVLLITEYFKPSSNRAMVTYKNLNNGDSNIYPLLIDGLLTPPPTNLPDVGCVGVPLCGGPSNGVCTQRGCQCISPWVGIDCLSQVVIISPPNINTSNPETGNNYTTTLPNGKEVQLKTLISILSINQLNHENMVVTRHVPSTWVYRNTTSQLNDSNIQEFNYQGTIINGNITTNVTVIVQYYKNQQIIKFADKNMTILPSSLKYSIEISPYYFNSSVNSLQLIMSASIQSISDDSSSCSYQESGTTIDNEDYVKLQIDEHSLYAKFIKFGLIDNRTREINNKIINSADGNQTATSNIQLIGIQIPHFVKNAILDPDFSLLLDTKPASDKENALCESKETRGLTKAQLAGIIIAATCGGIILIGALFYTLYRNNLTFKIKIQSVIKLK
ncbi:EGF-like domain-containing protein [Tieghemostelium lacteum]|uniref:EGF-like domain-containing protein n=1 Tax=Tieghemostelium lacteum TaxID=361077 RepID=A0A151ZB36_TIELA|nr:EGF-like domain-containing protein [Tieghemostelium lacteum]|eukprot:KYQ91162.1 EGF-like domain-containing protein [Tieghemostelium lacteum]